MANRIPLVLDETNGRLQEIPNGDDLDLAGNSIVNLTGLTTTSGVTVGGSLNVSGTTNTTTLNGTIGNFTDVVATTVITTDLTTQTLQINTTDFTIAGNPLADVAFSGSYLDLSDQPEIAGGVQADWGELNPDAPSFILNKPLIPGNIFDLGIFDGTDGQFLRTNGQGDVAFADLPIQEGGGGAEQFTDLTDVPASYTGFADNVLAVNPTEDGLVYFNLSTLSLTSLQVTDALGFTPYDVTNPDGYYNSTDDLITSFGYTPYDGTGNPLGFLTAESQNLDDVVQNGASTTSVIGVGGINSTGGISSSSGQLSLAGNIEFAQDTGTFTIDGQDGSTMRIASASALEIGGGVQIGANVTVDAAAPNPVDIGTATNRFNNFYVTRLNISEDSTHTGSFNMTAATGMNLTATSGDLTITATNTIIEDEGILRLGQKTRTQRDAFTASVGDVVYTNDDRIPQIYIPNYDGTNDTWVAMAPSYGPEPSVETVYPGMIAIADGSAWDPEGDGQEHLMCYLNGEFRTIF